MTPPKSLGTVLCVRGEEVTPAGLGEGGKGETRRTCSRRETQQPVRSTLVRVDTTYEDVGDEA